MIETNYITLQDFKIVDVATHCDYSKLNIAINEALNFELPEILCEYYDIILDAFNSEDKTELQLKLLNGDTYKCGRITKKYLGVKQLLVYYSYANYLLNSSLTDSGLGFKQKTDQYSIPTPLKEIQSHANKYRNMGFAIVKQLKDYLYHNPELANEYGFKHDCDCGCEHGNCEFTEKRMYVFKPRIIRK